MKPKELLAALEAVRRFIQVDPSDGGPQSAGDIRRYEAAGMALANVLSREHGYLLDVIQVHTTYVSHVNVFRVIL